jgi:hypothetical protein
MAENSDTDTDTITIDGKEYSKRDLSEKARAHIVNLHVVDQEITRLKLQIAIAQTARAAYASALKAELPE